MRCVHDLTDPGLLFIRCSSALISLPGSNLISFLAAISSASWQQSHQLHSAAALVTEGHIHTWMSSDSQLTWSLHSALSKTWLQSPLP
ncbi:unnamed protein product, partial [Staurois parvus]